nr:uncharacterized protein LOC109764661 [Aegilops tauschii subsp. strangulata]
MGLRSGFIFVRFFILSPTPPHAGQKKPHTRQKKRSIDPILHCRLLSIPSLLQYDPPPRSETIRRCRGPIGAAAGAGQPPHRCARRVAAPAPVAEHSSSSGAPAATTFLLLSGKSAQDQQLLASAAGELSLAEEGGGELAVSLALDASGDAGYDAAAYMGALQARRFGRWMRWSPRMASTDNLVIQNFAKLPVGVVCATYMQFKGRVDDSLDISTRYSMCDPTTRRIVEFRSN